MASQVGIQVVSDIRYKYQYQYKDHYQYKDVPVGQYQYWY